MKQAIADVSLPELDEVNAMTVWPTIGAMNTGRLVGRLASIRIGLGSFFTLGTVLAAATIPISLAVYAWQLLPFICRRYTVTNRRIVIKKGYSAVDDRSIDLDAFDTIDMEILPGQDWLHAGELVFRRQGTEAFRLSGVSRPQVFRSVCLKARTALVSVREVCRQQSLDSTRDRSESSRT